MPNLRILSKRISTLLRQANLDKDAMDSQFSSVPPSATPVPLPPEHLDDNNLESTEGLLATTAAEASQEPSKPQNIDSKPEKVSVESEYMTEQTIYDSQLSAMSYPASKRSKNDFPALIVRTEIFQEDIRKHTYEFMPYIKGVPVTAERRKDRERLEDARSNRLAAFRALKKTLKHEPKGQGQAENDSPELLAHMESLRNAFVCRARHYLGCPYRKGAKPRKGQFIGNGTEDPNLFLDCCGLVRRCVQDLKEDFKFELGPWNQSYLFDILPVKLSPKEMLPGDLIFVQGRYYDKTKKRPPHDILHVEIFIGGKSGITWSTTSVALLRLTSCIMQAGEGTIGARDRNGAVDEHSSWKIEAKTYAVQGYHFRSISTWLRGTCRSFCPLHAWDRHFLKHDGLQQKNEANTVQGEDSQRMTTVTGLSRVILALRRRVPKRSSSREGNIKEEASLSVEMARLRARAVHLSAETLRRSHQLGLV